MQLTFASYNIHKAVGLDRRRDPERILAVLHEIDADVIALQEADRRIGRRESVLPLAHLEEHTPYCAVRLNHRPDSLGWHGNALLVRRGIKVAEAGIVPLPALEPRGAIRAGGYGLVISVDNTPALAMLSSCIPTRDRAGHNRETR